ncbi:aspartate/glutamate racemase family protein (plasmid) [Haloferax mediterranei ATCC 33500]|nr:aspartate/glutamate racemase family protein [Haloferax mediterranei]AFK20848.1 aspartate racemase [Haloferax mediterranei ATCC 33500]EMA05361.1 aspartate racemase [Haloferax mediterranei ATCC 33500]MDX5989840.1 aspartate/glutamate racemase family protein [Haloferax mediterranei ATCC 33500]QCQ77283.1 aspartate/glutamate racemase family protein [Haloferax mediterranei ATCC 33500]
MSGLHRDEPRTIGILGGMSSQSTVEYYRLIDDTINDIHGGHYTGDIVIRSVNFADIEGFIQAERWDEAGAYLAEAAHDLEAGGADFVLLATNTMHKVAPSIVDALSVPLVHIVDVAADAIRAAGIDTVGVLGTQATMQGDFYRDRFADHGIDIVVPDRQHRPEVDRIIFEELTKGEIRDESRDYYLEVIDNLVAQGAEGIVLGCTEIELLVDQSDRPETPLFDTTALHVERAVEYSLSADAEVRSVSGNCF